MNNFPLILASASPRRSTLLAQLGLAFTVVSSDVEEVELEQYTVRELALLNAHRKARAVAKRHPDALVLGADTIVCLGSRIFGKPASREQAGQMISTLQGKTHQVVTGVCLVQHRTHRERLFADRTDVRFRALSADEIERYLRLVNPLDKAGGYAIQEYGDLIVEEISGSLSNVVGLPIEQLQSELRRWNS